MKQIYKNDVVVNNGLSLNGNQPLDDRLVWEGLDSLYISPTNPASCPLYKKAYKGMVITIFHIVNGEEVRELFILKDASPYTPGRVRLINQDNWNSVWQPSDERFKEYVDTSIAGVTAHLDASFN